MASSAICVGKNCELLESMVSSKGMSLQMVLNEIQGNIIDPILDSQMKMATWENGVLDFSPSGAQDGIKVTVWGGTTWHLIPVNGTIFNTGYSSSYNTGAMSARGGIEYPLSSNTDLILNVGLWNGPTDYGLGMVEGSSKETIGKLGGGLRRYFERNDFISFYFTGGLVIGARHTKIDFNGTNIKIATAVGKVGWQGVESYEETSYFLSTPMMLGSSVKLWDITLSADIGARLIGQIGKAQVGKYGSVGPFFGETGYFAIGIASDRDISTMQIWPILRVGVEWNPIQKLSILSNWQPKISDYPNQINGGVSWQFLRKIN